MKAWARKQTGFTIVELLIVIVVIGILATITVIAFTTARSRAYDASIQQDLKNLATKVGMHQATFGSLPSNDNHFSSMGLKVSKNAYDHYYNGTSYYNLVYCYRPSVNPTEFAIIAYGKNKSYKYEVGGRLTEFTGAKTGSVAACADAGVTLDSGSDRYWFYDNDAWRSFL